MKNLKTRQICLFFIAILPVSKIFILPSTLATYSQNDLWISAIFNFLLDFVCVLAIIRACKNSKMSYFELIESTFGKVFSKVILALYFCYFMIKAVIPLNEQKDYVEQTLYTLMPSKLYFLPFFSTNNALNELLPSGFKSAFKFQYSCGLKPWISRSLSTTSLSATD